MSWDLIPEIFFDLIARVVPGSLVLLCTGLVYVGPERACELLVSTVPAANLASVLLFGVVAYFAAIILSQLWDASAAVWLKKANARGVKPEDLSEIRRQMPTEAARLLKLQAEKNFCEVIIPGFSILLVVEVWFLFTRPDMPLGEHVPLLIGLAVVIALCLRWRAFLESLYLEGVTTLSRLAKGLPAHSGLPSV